MVNVLVAIFGFLWLTLVADACLTAFNNGHSRNEIFGTAVLVLITGPIGWMMFEFSDGMQQGLEG